MIVVAGTIQLQPDKREQALALAREMMAESAREAGCIVYRFMSDLEQPERLYVYEEWESAEALAAHGDSAHMARFRERLPECVAAAPQISRYAVTEAG